MGREVTYKWKNVFQVGTRTPARLGRAPPGPGPGEMLQQLHPAFPVDKQLFGHEFATCHLLTLAGDRCWWRNKTENKISCQPRKPLRKHRRQTVSSPSEHLTSMCGVSRGTAEECGNRSLTLQHSQADTTGHTHAVRMKENHLSG